ncbi:uncharacterized protein LOC130968336 isoform X4 [Arachis stenosperma]|uniref:uncharacterized protein LOC130968336 isoform X4 n=1 Tax=Arachis stenosperma TaxID=217475 RepID=UPI0025AB8055|nr:uncharacterized protein LOC130968336 isoform X4 [Arachis stenosperma]
MTNFTVVSNHGSYRATSHEFKLVFLHRSTVIPVGEDVILKTCFNMFPFSELLNMTQDYDFLVGLLTSVGEAKEYAKEEKIGKIIVLELTSKNMIEQNVNGTQLLFIANEGKVVSLEDDYMKLTRRCTIEELQDNNEEVFFEVLDASSHHREKVIHKDHVVTFKEKMNLSL